MASYARIKLTDQNDIRTTRYWCLDFTKSSGLTTSDYLDEYDELLTQAVKLRLRSDVPLCLTFSGGVDSGTIAAFCAKKLNTNLQLFCIDYHTNENQSPEVLQAQHVANHLDLDLTLIHYEYDKIFDDLPKFYHHFDQPCIQLALTYSAILYNQIHSLCKVTLSGNGADELFTGYIGDHFLAKKDKILALLKPLQFILPGLSKHLDPVQRAYRNIEDIDISTLKNEMLQSNVQTFTDLNMYTSLLY